jgi:organic radical activating enzyme
MTNTNEVRIENCTQCNYQCKFCPHATESFTRLKEVMDLGTFKNILDKIKKEAPQITECTISGFGEPLLDSTILDKIYYAALKGYKIHFVTNGSTLNYNILEKLFYWKINDIRISYHATSLSTYKAVTHAYNDGNFYHSTKAINIALDLKKRYPTTQIIITMDVIEENEHCVQEMIDLYSKKVDLLEIWKPHNWINWESYREGDIVKTTCGRLFNGPLQIQVDGTVNACCFDYDGKLVFGNFLKQSLDDIFNSRAYKKLIEAHSSIESMKNSELICKNCDQLKNVGPIIIYNSKYSESERVGKTSTNYRSVE